MSLETPEKKAVNGLAPDVAAELLAAVPNPVFHEHRRDAVGIVAGVAELAVPRLELLDVLDCAEPLDLLLKRHRFLLSLAGVPTRPPFPTVGSIETPDSGRGRPAPRRL